MSRSDRCRRSGRRPSLRHGLAIPAALLALGASAQDPPSRGFEDETTRILQVERVDGDALVLRGGREIALQAGYLVFGQERVMVARDARVDLRLAGLGDVDVVGDRGEAVVTVDKLPFSAWAVELDIWFRLERGRLSVDWRRPGAAERWPLFVQIGNWTAHLEAGEFLMQRTDGAGTICANSGSAELADDSGQRQRLESGGCIHLRDGEAASADELRIEQWEGMARPAPAPELPAVGTGAQDGMDRSLHAAARVPAPVVDAPGPSIRVEVVPPPESPPIPVTAPAPAPAVTEPSAPPAKSVVATPARSASPEPVPATPTPAPTPAPAAAPAAPRSGEQTAALAPLVPEPPSGPEWIINVLTVADPALAEQHVRTLTAAGYPAELRPETVRGRSSFRVIIPRVNSEQAAGRIVQLLADKMGYPSAWALQKR